MYPLIILLCAALAQADAPSEPPVVDCPNMMYRPNSDNIDAFLAYHRFILFFFHHGSHEVTWGVQKTLMEFSEYLTLNDVHAVVVAEVDLDVYPELAERLGVKGTPMLKFYHHGRQMHFSGEFSYQGLIRWVTKRVELKPIYLSDRDEFSHYEDDVHCVVYQHAGFHEEEIAMLGHLPKVHHDVIFYFTDIEEFIEHPDEHSDFRVEVYRKADNATVHLSGNGTLSEHLIHTFVKRAKLHDFRVLTPRLSNYNFHHQVNSAYIFYDQDDDPRLQAFKQAGNKYKDKLDFFLAKSDSEVAKRMIQLMHIKPHQMGLVKVLQFQPPLILKYRLKKWTTYDELDTFLAAYVKGKAEAYMKSEPLPTGDEGVFKKLVARNVQSLVFDNPNDVLVFAFITDSDYKIEMHILEQLEDRLAHAHEFNLTLASYNAGKNDHHGLKLNRFPTIALYKAGRKHEPMQFEGTIQMREVVRWLERCYQKKIRYPGQDREFSLDDSL